MVNVICILGRQPEFGLAELESLVGSDNISAVNQQTALVDDQNSLLNINNLGGTLKLGRLLTKLPTKEWGEVYSWVVNNGIKELTNLPDGKIKFGISSYGMNVSRNSITSLGVELKRKLKANGRSARYVPNVDNSLSTAQVLHNKLTGDNGFELLICSDSENTYISQTTAIQNINAYSKRDQNRPKRDAKVGMMPPKLAQILINIANPKPNNSVLDPFCGTGVIMQEALLMGHPAFGSDIDQRMVDYTKTNLEWLASQNDDIPQWNVDLGDATTHKWTQAIECVVAETYLGKPLSNIPGNNELSAMISEINQLIESFLQNLGIQLSVDSPICLAIPAWKTTNGFQGLPLLDHLEELGYNHMSFKTVNIKHLIYHRPNQLVARQVLALRRK